MVKVLFHGLYKRTVGRWSETEFWSVMGVLAAISLVAYWFVVLPIVEKSRAATQETVEAQTSFSITNSTEETWKDVRMNVFGPETITDIDPRLPFSTFTDELGTNTEILLGDMIPGYTHNITLYFSSLKGDEIDIQVTYTDSGGRHVHEPEERTIKFS